MLKSLFGLHNINMLNYVLLLHWHLKTINENTRNLYHCECFNFYFLILARTLFNVLNKKYFGLLIGL